MKNFRYYAINLISFDNPGSRNIKTISCKKVLCFVLSLHNMLFFAQQNLINLPTAEATEKNKIFFQQQININELIQSNTTFDIGFGKGFEAGINVLGLNFSEKRYSILNNDTNDVDPYNPLIMANGLKQFDINKNIAFAFGGQVGLNFDFNKKRSAASLVYTNLVMKDLIIGGSQVITGIYYNSQHYGGTGNRIGFWLGTEIPANKKIHFLAESILGNNAISYTSVGIVYYPKKWLPLTLGIQIPNTKKNAYAIVFELTFLQSAKKRTSNQSS